MRKVVIFFLIIVVCAAGAIIIWIKSNNNGLVFGNDIAQLINETASPIDQKHNTIVFVSKSPEAAIYSKTEYEELTATRKELDTPFISKFRKLYESENDQQMRIVMYAYRVCENSNINEQYNYPCTEKDIVNIRGLAEKGDHFSLSFMSAAMLSPKINPDMRNWRELAIEKGEVVQILHMAGRHHFYKDFDEMYRLLNDPRISEHPLTHGMKMLWYVDDSTKFCEAVREAYEKFGLRILSGIFANNNKWSFLFFSECGIFDNKMSKEEILNKIDTEEARLIKAALFIGNGNEEMAAKLFEKLYKEGSPIISINAGYCLAVMHYYGRGGYTVDKKKGRELLDESVNNGYFFIYGAFPEYSPYMFPQTDKLTYHTAAGICDKLSPHYYNINEY